MPGPHVPGTPEAARALVGLARSCADSGIARRALVLRLSLLPQDRAHQHHRTLASEALDPLAGADRARLFRLPNADLVLVWRGAASEALTACLATLRLLFAEPDIVPDTPDTSLTLLLDLPADSAQLIAIAQASLRPAVPDAAPRTPRRPPLDIAILGTLEDALAHASVARFARRWPVCRSATDDVATAWDHRFLSIDELADTLVPDRDPRADPWLLRHLTRALDRRLLALLAAPEELRDATPFGIDLHVTSLLSPEFLRFDAGLPATLRGRVVLTLHAHDILIDHDAFAFARDFARTRAYRLMLNLPELGQLDVYPRERLGFDFVRLRWSAAWPPRDTLDDASAIVLGHCDSDAALAWGRRCGIHLFERPPVPAAWNIGRSDWMASPKYPTTRR